MVAGQRGAMARTDSLTGVWEGQYSYPFLKGPNLFTAVLIQSGGHLGGQIHETSDSGRSRGQMLIATVTGQRSGAEVSFVKVYDRGPGHQRPVHYEGRLNAEATEIHGRWKIPRNWGGRFVMTRPAAAAEKAKAETSAAVPRARVVERV